MQKKVRNKLIEDCVESIEETGLAEINSIEFNCVENKCKHNSCTLDIVLFSIISTLEMVAIFFVFIGTKKKMLFVLGLVPTPKQQFNELINGKSQTTRD